MEAAGESAEQYFKYKVGEFLPNSDIIHHNTPEPSTIEENLNEDCSDDEEGNEV